MLEADGEVLATRFDEEVVVLNLRDGIYYGLEDVGARIWQLLQQPISIVGLRDALVADYDVESTRCERDVRMLVGELAAKGLIRVREDA